MHGTAIARVSVGAFSRFGRVRTSRDAEGPCRDHSVERWQNVTHHGCADRCRQHAFVEGQTMHTDGDCPLRVWRGFTPRSQDNVVDDDLQDTLELDLAGIHSC